MPDPTIIVMRVRRPRGLVITMSVLVTMGLVIAGILALTRFKDRFASAESQPASAEVALAQATPEATPDREAAGTTEPPAPGAGAAGNADAPAAAAAGTPDEPGDKPGDEPGDEPGDKPGDEPGDKPGDKPGDEPSGGTASAQAADEPSEPERSPAVAAQTSRGPGRSSGRSDDVAPRQPESAWVALTIEPDSATVTVDGDTYRGSGLQRMGPLEPGTHTLRISAPGYESVERTVEVAAGKTERVSLTLTPATRGPGKVRVTSAPAGATVLVDGKVRGVTPVTLELPAGKTYELTLSQTGYETWRTLIEPAAGKKVDVETTLSRKPGAAPVEAEPAKKERDISVPASVVGDASRGRSLYERCRSCHGSKSTITPRSQTQSGWTRFLASRRHARHAELRPVFSVSELADVKAFLLENAADVDHGMAAGVR